MATDNAGGDAPEQFDNCVIIINKPCGQTSHEITTFVKKITGAKRSGHAGTLDPQVSGVLPVALGRATKLLRYIAGKDKTYVGIVKFRNRMDRKGVEGLFKSFTGELVQTPPKISAVRKVPRKRTVYLLELLEVSGRLALFKTNVDAGTYIRTLCEDMGKKAGGARMEELRRTAVGGITEKQAFTMQDLTDAMHAYRENGDASALRAMMHRPEEFIELPKVFIKESALKSVFSGAQVMAPAVDRFGENVKEGGRVAIYAGSMFVGVGIAKMSIEEIGAKKRGLAVKLERVHKPD